jgi:Tfp pilus assembly protein PilX
MMRRLFSRRDGGMALPVVMVTGLVMAVLVGGSLTAVSTGLKVSDRTQDTTGALDAAFAGVQEYSARLSANANYQAYGNPLSTFTVASGSVVVLPTTTNPAFGLGTTGTWASVPGSSTSASYRYEVDNSGYATTGVVNLRSTGRVGSVTRSVVAQVRQSGFINYLYFTDYEVQDPLISNNQACAAYAWQSSSTSTRNSNSCIISFAPTDTIQGPVHSNDTLSICGSTFGGAVTSSNPKTPISTTPSGCTTSATYAVGNGVTYSPQLSMPASNLSMQTVAAASGCLYTGPTQITYNNDGTMTVKSPWTKKTEPNGSSSTTPAMCGTIAALTSTSGAKVSVLANNLLYVQDVPTSTTDPNYSSTAKSSWPANFTCLDSSGSTAATSSTSSAGWTFGSTSYPMASEVPPTGWDNGSSWDTTTPAYGCRSGDLYVSGTVKGVTTAAASNYVYVVGDLIEKSRTADLIGLVGNSAILVYNPESSTTTTTTTGSGRNQQTTTTTTYTPLLTDSGREIDAAMLSVQHTFQVQNYNRGGTRGDLTVYGSIAQKYRGPVATASNGTIVNGYNKNYQYDSRLTSAVPPYFLAPTSSIFSISRVAQVAAAFSSTGA